MKHFLSLASVCLGLAASTQAQTGLRDIPDTNPQAQLDAFTPIEGASINLFAFEPAVANPVHMNWDKQGRLWVVSSPLYPQIRPGEPETDKIVILEDEDGDGVAEKHTVFADDLHIPTAILPVDGGAYVANSIEVLFLRDTDGDDIADAREVVLSGFGTEDTHHLVHTFKMGPEGMVWLNQSIYIHTHLETPYGIRRLLGGGMWHFRPETQRAEVFMKGLVHPWGHAFDDWAESFMTDGAGSNGINFGFPRSVFASSPKAARILPGLNPGQPKHCGLEVLNGRHLPDELQGVLAAPDFRGSRIKLFKLSDSVSAYISSQIDDLVSSKHRAFRPIDIKMGPDGALYVADWYNPIIQHGEVDFRDPRRDHKHGRIWRITFDGRELVKFPDLPSLSDEALVAELNSPEGLTRQLATVELRSRDKEKLGPALVKATAPKGVDPDLFELRRIWAQQALNENDFPNIDELVGSKNHKARAGALRALYYNAATYPEAFEIASSAVGDPHPQVRLWAVSVLAQLSNPDTVKTALRALEGVEVDEFLDFALWSICREHANRWEGQTESGNPFDTIPQLLFAARAVNKPVGIPVILDALKAGQLKTDEEVAEVTDFISKVGSADDLNAIFEYALAEGTPVAHQHRVLIDLGNAGKLRKLKPSGDTNRISRFLESDNNTIFSSAAVLGGQWDIPSAQKILEAAFLGLESNPKRAKAASDGLISLGKTSGPFFDKIIRDKEASFQARSNAAVGRIKISPIHGASLSIAVLNASPDGKDPHGIYDAILSNKTASDSFAEVLKKTKLKKPIALTGIQKASSAATRPENVITGLQTAGDIQPMKMALSPEEMEAMMQLVADEGDPHHGEEIYRRAQLQCLVCHAIGGAGGVIGPDLVSIGSSAPVDYLVDSLLQPSVKIKEGYHTTLVTLKNGDAVAGAIAREDANEIVIRDAAGNENRIPKSEVASNNISPVSLMPPGLTASLREDEFVDLVRFLSELGKEGDFKTPSNRYIRNWQFLQPHDRIRDAIGHYGNAIFAEDLETYAWMPALARVAGDIPLTEAPDLDGRRNDRHAAARTFIEVADAGEIRIKVSGEFKDLALFHGEKEVPLPDDAIETEITLVVKSPGKQKLTLAGLKNFGLDGVSVELLDDASVTQLVELKDF